MKKILLTLISTIVLLLSSSCSEDEPIYIYGNIVGKITEESNSNAIEGATVEISGIEQSVKTGSNGMFNFEKLPAGNYIIYVSKDGYVADSKNITVVATQTVQCDFSLLKNLPEVTPSEITLTPTKTSATIELTNTRNQNMDFAIHTTQSWITVSPANGTIASKNKKILKVSADLSAINYGEYAESIVINVGQSSLSIPVQVLCHKPSYIEIISPEKGNTYLMGDLLPIIWNSNIGGDVKIELLNNGSVQQIITPSVENCNTNSHSWSIPSLQANAYQIQITNNGNPDVFGLSEVFYIEEGPTLPVVTTGEITSITSTTLTISGCIEDFGKTFDCVTQYGHVYSEVNPTPTISAYKYNHGSTNQLTSYSTNITNLKPNTRYYIRAYAENHKGISYGKTISVTTKTADENNDAAEDTDAVDLGLSVKWAKCNIGATVPEKIGDYYVWGLTEISSNSAYVVTMDDISGNPKYDAACTKLGGNWRMPTKAEFEELINNCSWNTTNKNGVNGYEVVGPNGNSIFLPITQTQTSSVGPVAYYWSSTPDGKYYAYSLFFYYSGVEIDSRNKTNKYCIRPVTN